MSEKGEKKKNTGKTDKPQKKKEQQNKPNKIPKSQQKNEKPTSNRDENVGNSSKKDIPAKPSTAGQFEQSNVSTINENYSHGKYSKRKIEKSESKSELPENIYDRIDENFRGADMGELLKKPISIGDHFQFKHEKFWNFTSQSLNDSGNFTLDFNKLVNHVLCVPFYERNDLDPSIFTEEQLQHMKRVADMHKMTLDMKNSNISNDNIDSLISSSDDVDPDDAKFLQNYLNKNSFTAGVSNVSNNMKTFHDSELDELLNMAPNNVSTVNKETFVHNNLPEKAVSNTEENLEDWLDEFLGK